MLPKETVEQILNEAELRMVNLEEILRDCDRLHLEKTEQELFKLRQFYQERIELLCIVLQKETLPF